MNNDDNKMSFAMELLKCLKNELIVYKILTAIATSGVILLLVLLLIN